MSFMSGVQSLHICSLELRWVVPSVLLEVSGSSLSILSKNQRNLSFLRNFSTEEIKSVVLWHCGVQQKDKPKAKV